MRITKSIRDRFWSKVNKTSSPHGCWLWTGASTAYGKLNVGGQKGGKYVNAHQLSWIIHKGQIPDGKEVCHDCPGGDNKLCVNPSHLWIGTHADNLFDSAAKGIRAIKLTGSQVNEIREAYAADLLTGYALATKYKVSSVMIYRIINRKNWRHL